MSKLNEEILDVLFAARVYMQDERITENESEKGMHCRLSHLRRLDRVWDYFHAQRTIEDFRREEE